MPNLTSQQWKYLLAGIVIVDLLIVGGVLFYLDATGMAVSAAPPVGIAALPTATATPWVGPPPQPTDTPTLPATPLATDVLAASGFPPGFTPTPRPTREPVNFSLPRIFIYGNDWVDVPELNQFHYPEPFFPPGRNNACGPVTLFAAFQGLGVNVDYGRVRDVAVTYGYGPAGISQAGLVNAVLTLNNELGNPFIIEYGNYYRTKDLITHIRQGDVVIVLVRVKREWNGYHVTGDRNGSIGHFLAVERVSVRKKRVKLAGSTLGMDQVSLSNFTQSWASNPQPVSSTAGWRAYLRNEPAINWALIIKPRS